MRKLRQRHAFEKVWQRILIYFRDSNPSASHIVFTAGAIVENHPEQVIAGLNECTHCELNGGISWKLLRKVLTQDRWFIQPFAIEAADAGYKKEIVGTAGAVQLLRANAYAVWDLEPLVHAKAGVADVHIPGNFCGVGTAQPFRYWNRPEIQFRLSSREPALGETTPIPIDTTKTALAES